jgi:alkylation response protein AidB-like acyl-CoA dehydrogenase
MTSKLADEMEKIMTVSSNSAVELGRKLAQEVAPRAAEADLQGKMPLEDVAALKSSGYLALAVPREYGGSGLPLRDCVAAHLELAQGSTSTAMVAGMPLHIFGHASEVRRWPEETFAWFCREVIEHQAIFNSVASEPLLGSPSRGGLSASTATPHPDGWVVNGHKTWTTGGPHLTHMLVRVRVEEEPAVVLVLQDMPGIRWVDTWSTSLSLRASESHDVHFENVVVPSKHMIECGKSEGPPAPSAWFPMVMGATYLGAALAARDAVIKYALERVPTALGKPISTVPKIQRQIGEIDLELQATLALVFEVAGEWVGDDEHRSQQYPRIVAAKQTMVETANRITDKALQIAGGSAITRALPLERHFRDVRAGLMQPPSGDTALEIIGRYAIEQVNSANN